MEIITEFRAKYRFLSNFYPSSVLYDGSFYPSVEHAFQAAKCNNLSDRVNIRLARTPGEAKRLGQHVELRPDWEEVKVAIMYVLLKEKFNDSSELAPELLATGSAELIEGNNWGDQFWGMCNGKGENNLGKLLMRVRSELKTEYFVDEYN